MPFLSADSLSLVDIILLVVILIGLPLEALFTIKSSRAELASGKPGVRVKHYTTTMILLWAVALPILVLWAWAGRDWGALGFQLPTGDWAWAGWALAALIVVFFCYQFAIMSRSDSARRQLRDGLEKNPIISNFMPQTDAERRVFNVLGLTAGITEEIIFRGYLIWALALFMPVWMAAMAALLIFTLLHLYQGVRQLPGVFLVGGLVTLVFLLSGSLWPAIALHAFIDVINNSTVWKVRSGGGSAFAVAAAKV